MYQYKPHGGGLGGGRGRGLGFRAGKEWGLDQRVKILVNFPMVGDDTFVTCS